MHIRLLQPSDLDFCDELRRLAGWNQLTADWSRFLRLSPQGCFVAEWNGRPVGTVTTLMYEGKMAWIGMLIVHPDCRGQGAGRALLNHAIEFLRDRQIRSIKLDATPQGEPLYLEMGFRPEFSLTRWQASAPHPPGSSSTRVRPMLEDDLEQVIRLDCAAFGAFRGDLIHALFRDSARGIVAGDAAGLHGFALLRPGSRADYLGPLVAATSDVCRALASELIGMRDKPIYWDMPDREENHLPPQLGFAVQRRLLRMWIGENVLAERPDFYWGLVDPACG